LCSGASSPTTPESGEYLYDYYCPLSNATLSAGEHDLRLFGHAYIPFPQSVAEIGRATKSWFGARLADCSTADFVCFEVKAANIVDSYFLFAPRRLEAPKEYQLHGARAVSAFSTAPRSDAIQLVLWQPEGRTTPPMKLTLEKSRGVVFWSGIAFWDEAPRGADETCVLQSPTGLFNQVEVVVPEKRESVPD
jgi:hypothetical protein